MAEQPMHPLLPVCVLFVLTASSCSYFLPSTTLLLSSSFWLPSHTRHAAWSAASADRGPKVASNACRDTASSSVYKQRDMRHEAGVCVVGCQCIQGLKAGFTRLPVQRPAAASIRRRMRHQARTAVVDMLCYHGAPPACWPVNWVPL